MGRSMGGVHWRSDNTRSLTLGEAVATEMLAHITTDANEHPAFTFRSFARKAQRPAEDRRNPRRAGLGRRRAARDALQRGLAGEKERAPMAHHPRARSRADNSARSTFRALGRRQCTLAFAPLPSRGCRDPRRFSFVDPATLSPKHVRAGRLRDRTPWWQTPSD